jgi:hypothetical protein
MQKTGLEWIHRLIQEPGRLAGRYLLVGIPFASLLLAKSAMKGIARIALQRPADAESDAGDLPPTYVESAESRTDRSQSLEPTPSDIESTETSNSQEFIPAADPHDISIHAPAGRLRGLILLGGVVRQNSLGVTLGRSALDLPVGNGKTILTRWLGEAAAVARTFGFDHLPVRLLVDSNAIEPRSAISAPGAQYFRTERDVSEYRGTGGLIGNIAVDYSDDDIILVGNAAQVLLDPLPALTMSLMKTRGVVSIIGHRDGEPSGLMLITCRALRLIPRVGFVDMKEQALPIIAKKYDVRVVQCRRPTGLAIRTLSDYIGALRALHQPTRAAATDPWAEDWKSTFAIVEPGATVAPSARIHDSVVLAGANVEANAVVVR